MASFVSAQKLVAAAGVAYDGQPEMKMFEEDLLPMEGEEEVPLVVHLLGFERSVCDGVVIPDGMEEGDEEYEDREYILHVEG
jgi:hypothetical protein